MGLKARGVQLKMIPEENGRAPAERIAEAIDVPYARRDRLGGAVCQRLPRGSCGPGSGLQWRRAFFFCVDAIQALGAFPLDVRAMKIDFLSCGGHKWAVRPEGCGFFYCNQRRSSGTSSRDPPVTWP
jgi:hypothetical protein